MPATTPLTMRRLRAADEGEPTGPEACPTSSRRPKRRESMTAMGRAPMVKISRRMPPTPVAAPCRGSMKLGIEQLGRISPGAKYKVVIFEFNAGNHAMKRALANACAINQLERLGDRV